VGVQACRVAEGGQCPGARCDGAEDGPSRLSPGVTAAGADQAQRDARRARLVEGLEIGREHDSDLLPRAQGLRESIRS
jgi:hypothetical protein